MFVSQTNNFSFSFFFTYPNIKHKSKKEYVQLKKSVSDIIIWKASEWGDSNFFTNRSSSFDL